MEQEPVASVPVHVYMLLYAASTIFELLPSSLLSCTGAPLSRRANALFPNGAFRHPQTAQDLPSKQPRDSKYEEEGLEVHEILFSFSGATAPEILRFYE